MPLLRRIPEGHTIRRFRTSARLRFQEAGRAAGVGDRLICIYLCGYAAEMQLKAAYFRTQGWLLNDPITMIDLRNARQRAVVSGLTWSGNLHDLDGWAALVIEARRTAGPRHAAYAPRFSRELTLRVRLISSNWREDLRYQPNRPYHWGVEATLDSVAWLQSQSRRL